jgi:hypothetical protein
MREGRDKYGRRVGLVGSGDGISMGALALDFGITTYFWRRWDLGTAFYIASVVMRLYNMGRGLWIWAWAF